MNNQEAGRKFLHDLIHANTSERWDMIIERIGDDVMMLLDEFSYTLDHANMIAKHSSRDLARNALIIGYVLNTHIKRHELEESIFGNNNEE